MSEPILSETLAVPTTDLRDVLEPHLARIESTWQEVHVKESKREKLGCFAQVAQDAAHALGDVQAPTIIRRIFGIRKLESITTNIDIADALLMAVDVRFDDVPLPVFPMNGKSALSMVDDHCPDLPLPDRLDLSGTLLRFATAFLREQAPEETHEFLARQMANKRAREARRREAA